MIRAILKSVSFRWLSMIACFVHFTGCGSDGPQLGMVTGTITLDGKPVPNALVTFHSKAADGSSSFGKTNAKGFYRLEFTTDRLGAMLGPHDVEVQTKRISKSEMPDDGTAEQSEFVAIPKHYTRGVLKAEVKAGSNVCNFELTTGTK